ncbi:hypothetical protein B0H19DRAFT_1055732 [Mycena capillaripes]|nr:hypothetical protein B0H19DRAFT_1055732 [Mycena capillaripes]
MFNSKTLLASTVVAFLSLASAAPANPVPNATPTVKVCTGDVGVSGLCVDVPAVSDSCVNLTGGFTILNKEISSAVVPGGMICTFFEDFGCFASGDGNASPDGEVLLLQGTWSFFSVPGLSGPMNFNDLTSSFSCSPL